MLPLARGLLPLAAIACSACVGAGTFVCHDDAACGAGGRCEGDGTCAFADTTCALGWRVADYAGDQTGVCANLGAAVVVAAGAFDMGCAVGSDTRCETDELPQHQVMLTRGYLVDVTEVSQAAYRHCVDAKACRPPTTPTTWNPARQPRYPVTGVSFDDARTFCAWAGKRLPTEAEWEKAARGSDGRLYPWGNEPITCDRANYDDCGDHLSEVGARPLGASAAGALDMAGNAWELVTDFYGVDYYTSSPGRDPTGPATGTDHGLRGGDYAEGSVKDRSSNRSRESDKTPDLIGFRCVKDL